MKHYVLAMLEERHIHIREMAALLYEIQSQYISTLTMDMCHDAIIKVLEKREVQFNILTGLVLDIAAEKKMLPETLNRMIESDYPMYGVDENIGFAIAGIYGTISMTNYGYLDKEKPGLISQLNNDKNQVNTFADDIASALIAAAAARLAHQYQGEMK